MRYIQINWRHSHPEDPYQYLIELDEQGYETKKIEFYLNGEISFACDKLAKGTFLSPQPFEGLSSYCYQGADEEINAIEITAEVFFQSWSHLMIIE